MFEADADLKRRISDHLTRNGYVVSSFSKVADGLVALANTVCSVVISSHMMPEMGGDAILEQVLRTAPDTQRILIVEHSKMDTLINAINVATIHACLPLPVREQDLLNQVSHCCRQYDVDQKRKELERLTQRQNEQLRQIAVSFKKKEALYAGQMEQKKREIRILESKARSVNPPQQVPLKDILDRWNIPFSPESFATQLTAIQQEIKKILEDAAFSAITTLSPDATANQPDLSPDSIDRRELAGQFLSRIYGIIIKKDHSPRIDTLDDFFELTLADNNTAAFLRIKKKDPHSVLPSQVRLFLEEKRIIFGIVSDHDIESGLFKLSSGDEPFLVAQAKEPIYPKDAQIQYFFPMDLRKSGSVRPDGSMDYSDRGEIPHVESDTLLAQKTFPETGIPGMDVFGRTLSVDDPNDRMFSPGTGTRLSRQGDKIYSNIAGQPHLDALGNISVFTEYRIQGDLGFETGNVNFKGNVIVSGTIKPGLKIRCASLTAKEINGAHIDIDGDLNVSLGIVDTRMIKVKGAIQAKFVHNSTITAFGNLTVQKEIIDSSICLSGACVSKNGRIINSEISAKMGIHAGTVGQPGSRPATLRMGVDEQVNRLIAEMDKKREALVRRMNDYTAEITWLEKENLDLHDVISHHAHLQDRAQLEIKEVAQKIDTARASGNPAAVKKMTAALKTLKQHAKQAEEHINAWFGRQDAIAAEIAETTRKMEELEILRKEIAMEKQKLIEFSNRHEPVPEIMVAGTVEAGTRIFGPNTALVLRHAASGCRIRETVKTSVRPGDPAYFEIKIN